MTDNENIVCPISVDSINENAARIIASFVIAITLSGIYFNSSLLFTLLAADFAIRAFTKSFSPLRFLSVKISGLLNIKEKLTDAAPKKFGAALGFVFSIAIGVFQIVENSSATLITGGILIFCAALEGGLGICLGCHVYTYVILPFQKKTIRQLIFKNN